jgi:hypothetical protein
VFAPYHIVVSEARIFLASTRLPLGEHLQALSSGSRSTGGISWSATP